MKNKIALFSLLPLTALFLSGCTSIGPIAVKQKDFPKDKVDARALFVENCSKCHGIDGRADTFRGRFFNAQDLTDLVWQVGTGDNEIRQAIETGPKAMPAFKGKLSPAEIDALVTYVRTFKPVQ